MFLKSFLVCFCTHNSLEHMHSCLSLHQLPRHWVNSAAFLLCERGTICNSGTAEGRIRDIVHIHPQETLC